METKFWRKSRVITLILMFEKYNPNQDLVDINEYAKFGKSLSVCVQDNKQKRNYGGQNDGQNDRKSSIVIYFVI